MLIQNLKKFRFFSFLCSHPKISSFFIFYIFFIILYFIFDDFLMKYLLLSDYFGIFISGILYTFGTTGGASIFVILEQSKYYDPIQISILAGFGAGLMDLLTFRYMEKTFTEELTKISNLKFFTYVSNIKVKVNFINKNISFPIFANKFVFCILGLVLIASPMSDEFGIYFLSKIRHYKNIEIFIIGFLVNFIGIYILASL